MIGAIQQGFGFGIGLALSGLAFLIFVVVVSLITVAIEGLIQAIRERRDRE